MAILLTDSIVIVADSIVIGQDPKDGQPASEIRCKIRCYGSVCSFLSGRYGNPETRFDAWELARRAINAGGSLAEIRDRFDESVFSTLGEVVKISRTATPDRYVKWISGSPVLSAHFAAIDESGPRIESIEYTINGSGVLEMPRKPTFRPGQMGVEVVVTGNNSNIFAATKRDRLKSLEAAKLEPVDTATSWVQLEVDASRKAGMNDVGGPLAGVRLTRNGFQILPEMNRACGSHE